MRKLLSCRHALTNLRAEGPPANINHDKAACCGPVPAGTIFRSGYGKYKSVHKRFMRWAESGVWDRIVADLVKDKKNLYFMLDSTIVRAHQQAATGRKKGLRGQGSGAFQGGSTTKVHLLTDENGLPLDFVLTGGERHDCTQAIALLAGRKAEAVLADRAFDTDAILAHVKATGAEAVIPPKRDRKVQRPYDRRTL